jgi:hypothetical protein
MELGLRRSKELELEWVGVRRWPWAGVVPSWDRRGGRAIKPLEGADGVVILD